MRDFYFFGVLMLFVAAVSLSAGISLARGATPAPNFVRTTSFVTTIPPITRVDASGADAREVQALMIRTGMHQHQFYPGMKLTQQLCPVGHARAADLGIDNADDMDSASATDICKAVNPAGVAYDSQAVYSSAPRHVSLH